MNSITKNQAPQETKLSKSDLYREIRVTEGLIEVYSRIDQERVIELEIQLKKYEYQLLDILTESHEDWTEMFLEQNVD